MISEIRNVLSNKVIDNIKDEFDRIIYEAFKNSIKRNTTINIKKKWW